MHIEELGNLVPDGRLVHAKFISRTDGEVHEVIGRVGVSKYASGGGLKFNPYAKGLLPVFSYKRDSKGRFVAYDPSDRKGTGYRFIPSESIISIKSNGVTYDGDGNIMF